MNKVGFALAALLTAHVLADFYAQSDALADRKTKSLKALGLHCLLYAVVFGAAAALLLGGPSFLWIAVIGALAHAGIDGAKHFAENKIAGNGLTIFCADQLAHVVAIILLVAVFPEATGPSCLVQALGLAFDWDVFSRVAGLAFSLLLVGKPVEIFVGLVLNAVSGSSGDNQKNDDRATIELRAGRWIGILERVIAVVMTLWNEFGAIAFVLTAKSIARFDLLKDQAFAERYLVGTLTSVATAILVALLARGLLG